MTTHKDEQASVEETSISDGDNFMKFLKEEIWPRVSSTHRGKVISKLEREEILGYGPSGV